MNSNLLKSFKGNVTNRCQKSWKDVSGHNYFIHSPLSLLSSSSQINDNDKSIYKAFKCTDALFVLHVLDGMGFTDNNTEWSIKFVSQVRSHDSHVTVSPPTYIRSAD